MYIVAREHFLQATIFSMQKGSDMNIYMEETESLKGQEGLDVSKASSGQEDAAGSKAQNCISGLEDLDRRLVQVVPSGRQLRHQELEFYGFIHFTVNTFTDREWGDGTESPGIFNPVRLDARQWVAAAKDAGMRGLILTCKHHDGFCLWPSRYTRHSVASSPYRDGRGDVVREVSEACKEAGLAFGIYLSPWDRNHPSYGSGKEYDDYFVNQLTELLEGYGDIFAVWFDGACGEGKDGRKQVYDWKRYYDTVRRLQPGACISVCGPDVRWCGNEAGRTRPSEWSVVPARAADTEKIAENSQQADEVSFRQREITASDLDLGSRQILQGERDLIWYPAEVNTSIRPGWFYHASEDEKVKSLAELVHIYEHSVGGNATFLLNMAPDREGLISQGDVARLHELGEYLRETYRENLAQQAVLGCDTCLEGYGIENVRKDTYDTYFKTADGVRTCEITVEWEQPVRPGRLVLKENLLLGQRVERFVVEARTAGNFRQVYEGTVIGYKKIASLGGVETDCLRIRILDARVAPVLSFLGVYEGGI